MAWGHDVGRLYAWNTLGSCLGLLAVTFVGYEIHVVLLLVVIGLLLLALKGFWRRRQGDSGSKTRLRLGYATPLAISVIAVAFWLDFSSAFTGSNLRLFFGRDGVVGVDRGGNLFWNGLWHSQLSDGENHVGTNNWKMVVCGVASHPTGEIRDAAVVGLGTGITAVTLAKLDSVKRVDTYEINQGLKSFHLRYPDGTLFALDNPKIHVFWQDARTGLALRDRSYDLVVTQPLYLMQAGSSFLNSREFLALVRSRLRPRGVLCLYSRGTEPQKRALRETATRVFRYGESFFGGYLLVLSDWELELGEQRLAERFRQQSKDPLWQEIQTFDPTRDAQALLTQLDRPRHSWNAHGLIVTDDHPVIEYPYMLKRMLRERDAAAAARPPRR